MPNTHVAVILGTRTKYERRLLGSYARSETLSFLFNAIPGRVIASKQVPSLRSTSRAQDFNITKSILDGPDLPGKEVHQCIARGFLQLLTAISEGATSTVILAHSRGAVVAIILAHLIQAVQKECAELEKVHSSSSSSLLQIINGLKFIDEYNRSDNLELVKIKLALAKNPEIIAQLKKLNLQNICSNIKNFKLNISGLDAVPGGGNHRFNLHWNCAMMLRIPKIVASYSLFIYLHERTRGFKPILPVADDASTQFSMQFLPGHHGTGSGNFGYQSSGDGFVRVNDGQSKLSKEYDTSTVQDLVLCRMITFIEAGIPGFKFVASNFEKVLERTYENSKELLLDWKVWLGRHGVEPLKVVAKRFISSTNQNLFLIELYQKIYRNLPGYESMMGFSYAGTRKGLASFFAPFAIEESVRKVFRLLEQPKRIVLSMCLLGSTKFMDFGARNIHDLYHSGFVFSQEDMEKIADHDKEPLLLKLYTGINHEIKHKASDKMKTLGLWQSHLGFYIALIATILVIVSLFGYFIWPLISPYILSKLALLQAAIIDFELKYKIIIPIISLLSSCGSLLNYLITPLTKLLTYFAINLAQFIEFISQGNEYVECIAGVVVPVVTYMSCCYGVKALAKELYHYTGLDLTADDTNTVIVSDSSGEQHSNKDKSDISPGRTITVRATSCSPSLV